MRLAASHASKGQQAALHYQPLDVLFPLDAPNSSWRDCYATAKPACWLASVLLPLEAEDPPTSPAVTDGDLGEMIKNKQH